MNKKTIIGIVIVLLIVVLIVVIASSHNTDLEKYQLLEKEKIKTNFKYKKKEYVLTSYYNDKDSYATNNLLLKKNNNYYHLTKIEKCDMDYFIKDNNIYIHCIGKEGNILKYSVNGEEVFMDILDFDYTKTPNISQIHITIDNVDKNYIYLKSNVKMDDSIEEGMQVKCSFDNKECEYY